MRTIAILVLLTSAVASAAERYVGPAACGQCHQAIAESYAKTGMARSFRSVQPGFRLPEFDGRAFLHSASLQKFTFGFDAGKNVVSREQALAGFPPWRVDVEYVLGSGDHARSYLHRTTENKLIEF